MEIQSLRIVPSSRPDPSSVTKNLAATSNSFGVQDTFRYGTKSLHSELSPSHPLENVLNKWEETQTNLKLTMQKRLYGIHAPIRHLMERSIVSKVIR
ncbi:5205_t:CDS:2 [Diversispora eburnea]|uniref:5205_t:CDS:1 n=1 Tax=Diversispora eburnea TaxID=1213867 RepID=A0A9N8Z0P6_9GLOM|nr:5205_t:CDS:2 [Diversispora eburnea]